MVQPILALADRHNILARPELVSWLFTFAYMSSPQPVQFTRRARHDPAAGTIVHATERGELVVDPDRDRRRDRARGGHLPAR